MGIGPITSFMLWKTCGLIIQFKKFCLHIMILVKLSHLCNELCRLLPETKMSCSISIEFLTSLLRCSAIIIYPNMSKMLWPIIISNLSNLIAPLHRRQLLSHLLVKVHLQDCSSDCLSHLSPQPPSCLNRNAPPRMLCNQLCCVPCQEKFLLLFKRKEHKRTSEDALKSVE